MDSHSPSAALQVAIGRRLLWTDTCSVQALDTDSLYRWTVTRYGKPYSYSQWTVPVNNSHLEATCHGQPLAMDSNTPRTATQPTITANCYGQPLAMDIRLICTVTCLWTGPLMDSPRVANPLSMDSHPQRVATNGGKPLATKRHSQFTSTCHRQPPAMDIQTAMNSTSQRTATRRAKALVMDSQLPLTVTRDRQQLAKESHSSRRSLATDSHSPSTATRRGQA